ncbi:MAG: WD40 repeat domain-containing protein [Gemmataceae bacterium]
MQGCKKNHYLIVVLGLAVSFGWFSLGGGQAGQNEKSPAVVRTFKGHKNVVYGVAFSPKGKYLVTGSWDKTLKMWDVNSGKVIRTFGGPSGHKEMVLTVDVSPDGRYIASGGQDRQLKIWDLPSTDARQQLDAKQELTGVDVSPDGKKLAIAGKDGVVRIHNSADFKKLLELTGHDGEVKSVQFSANGAVVGSSGVDGTLRFWNSANGQLINVIGAHEGAVNDLVIHPNNSNAYSVGEDGALRFWQLTAAKPREFTPMAKDIVVMEVSPDGNQVFTASADQKIRVSNYVNGQRRRELVGATSQVLSAGFNSNASQVAAGMKDGSVVVWNNGNGQIMGKVIAHDQVTGVSIRPQNDQMATVGSDGLLKVWNLPIRSTKSMKHPQEIMTAAMRSDGSRVYTGGKDKIVRSWVLSNNALERQFTGHPTAVTAIAVSPNGAYLASAGEDGVIRFWNQSNGQLTTKIGGHAGIVTSLSFNSQSNRLASCSADGTVKVWQLPVTDSRSLGHPDQVTSVVITPDGTRAVTGCNDKQVRLWNLSNGGLERAFGGHTLAIRAVGVSGNGQFVVGGGDDKSFSVWNLGNGQVIKKITVPNVIQAIALNRDGKLAVAGLADNSIKVFDVAKAKEKANFAGHQGAITGLAYTNGDKLLVSSSADKTIRVWDTANGKVRTTITHTGPVDAMAVTVYGQMVAGGSGK